jgi:hypothetical protein
VFRTKPLLLAGGVVVVIGIAIAIYASFHAGNSYQAFRHNCLAEAGDSVVQLTVSTHSQYMGGPATTYTMGCRRSDGSVISTAKTNKP